MENWLLSHAMFLSDDRFLDYFTLFIRKKTGNDSTYIEQVLEPAVSVAAL